MSRQSNAVVRPWRWRVREIIEEKGLTISEVARRAGVSRSTVQTFCRDPQHNTNTGMWGRLAKALGVPFAEMLESVSGNEEQIREHE
ncbi:MAG: helix-turn-helix transcriptional regulator [Ktedonobacteraceae bacterium]